MSKFDVEILGRLANLTPDEITAALAAIRAEAGSFAGQDPTPEIVSRSAELADAARQLTGEQTRRAGEAKNFADNLAALEELTAPAEPALTTDAPAETAPAEVAPESALKEEDPSDGGDTTPDAAQAPANAGEDAVTAAARRPLGSHNTGAPAGAPALEQVTYRTTAATGL